ncbi:MAG: head maturation protease, ClpP-related [Gemmobacter sp.]|uniref:head maturation protease, ClpP-related n=1 Tax=Gemmobacter sp. TaxID=1898957 RepID=UPI0039194512
MRHGRELILNGEIVLAGEVLSDTWAGYMWAEDVFFCPRMVREALAEIGPGRVTVRLSSYGGHVEAGEAIRAQFAAHPGGVRIVVEGVAMSAASLILMGARERAMSEGSLLMIHDPRGGAWGTQDDLRREADVLEKISAVAAQVYARASGQTVDAVREMMAAETFLTAAEALAAGFATEVVTDPEEQDPQMAARMARPNTRQAALAAMTAAARRVLSRRPEPRDQNHVPAREPAAFRGAPARSAIAEESSMTATPTTPAEQPAAPTQTPAEMQATAVQAERQRVTAIMEAAQPFVASGRLTPSAVNEMIASGATAESAAQRMLALMAAGEPPVGSGVRIVRDEAETRRERMTGALYARLSRVAPEDQAREFMGHSLVDMAADLTGQRRVPSTFAGREELVRMAFHSTSDFPAIFENALNRSLAARYRMATPTYRAIARQRSYADFRPHTTVRAGDFPLMQEVSPEGGELKSGTFGEARETTSVKPYGVRVGISRQMLVNDSLDAITQVLNDRAAAVARFEERVFYAMMLGGANADGPTLLETTRQVFNTTDGTKASANAAITVASVGIGTKALMEKTSKDGEKLGLFPAVLLTGPAKWLEAQQLATSTTPSAATEVNPFSGIMTTLSTPWITGNAWYLFASPNDAPCFEWGLLEGYDAPRFRIEEVFGVQGTQLSLEHDFGCGAIDFRGGFKNAGA